MADETHHAASEISAIGRLAPVTHSATIASVERDTGLGKDTLRVWERRYGFPQPVRNACGERVYPPNQVEKLRLMRHLIDLGHRPGKIVVQDISDLQALLSQGACHTRTGAPGAHEDLMHYIDLCKAGQFEQLRDALWQQLQRTGLHALVIEVAAPLNGMVGDLWARDRIAIYEERLYTESIQAVLRGGGGNAAGACQEI